MFIILENIWTYTKATERNPIVRPTPHLSRAVRIPYATCFPFTSDKRFGLVITGQRKMEGNITIGGVTSIGIPTLRGTSFHSFSIDKEKFHNLYYSPYVIRMNILI